MSNVLKIEFQHCAYSFTDAGWFNATEAANRFGKRLDNWLRLDETQDYIQVLDSILNPSEVRNLKSDALNRLIKTKRGKYGGGTWLHPKLAVAFARWLDTAFSVWCDLQIDKILRAGYEPPNMIKLLLADTVSEWELRFTPSFYHALAKVTKTKYNGHSQGTPSVFGQITLKWVYGEVLPSDVLAEVKNRKKDSEKMHQWLSKGGEKQLDQQIAKIEAIAWSSVDYEDFTARCYQSCKATGQLRLVYP